MGCRPSPLSDTTHRHITIGHDTDDVITLYHDERSDSMATHELRSLLKSAFRRNGYGSLMKTLSYLHDRSAFFP